MGWGAALAVSLAMAIPPVGAEIGPIEAVQPEDEPELVPLPTRRGYGFFGAALGVQVASALSSLVAYREIERRCLALDATSVAAGRSCMDGSTDTLVLVTVGGFLGRGSIALAAIGGDVAGTHDGAHDAWRHRPQRDARAHMFLGGVLLAAGVATLGASLSFQWLQRQGCAYQEEWFDYRECMTSVMYTGWGLSVASDASLAVGAGLLAYGNAYRDEHMIWSSKRHAWRLRPSLSSSRLGLDASLRF